MDIVRLDVVEGAFTYRDMIGAKETVKEIPLYSSDGGVADRLVAELRMMGWEIAALFGGGMGRGRATYVYEARHPGQAATKGSQGAGPTIPCAIALAIVEAFDAQMVAQQKRKPEPG